MSGGTLDKAATKAARLQHALGVRRLRKTFGEAEHPPRKPPPRRGGNGHSTKGRAARRRRRMGKP